MAELLVSPEVPVPQFLAGMARALGGHGPAHALGGTHRGVGHNINSVRIVNVRMDPPSLVSSLRFWFLVLGTGRL